jgi:hypothetical protein
MKQTKATLLFILSFWLFSCGENNPPIVVSNDSSSTNKLQSTVISKVLDTIIKTDSILIIHRTDSIYVYLNSKQAYPALLGLRPFDGLAIVRENSIVRDSIYFCDDSTFLLAQWSAAENGSHVLNSFRIRNHKLIDLNFLDGGFGLFLLINPKNKKWVWRTVIPEEDRFGNQKFPVRKYEYKEGVLLLKEEIILTKSNKNFSWFTDSSSLAALSIMKKYSEK